MMFLVGDFSQIRDRFGQYPEAVLVKEQIEKRDLLRSKENTDHLVINLDDLTVFIPEKNVWLPLGK